MKLFKKINKTETKSWKKYKNFHIVLHGIQQGLITAHSSQHSTGRNTDIGVLSTTATVQTLHSTATQGMQVT